MKKNDVVTVEVTDIGIGGEGIGKVDGYTLFIKDAVIGDTVEVKSNESKKELRICEINADCKRIRISCICTLSGGKTLWRMPDSGDGLSETAGV